MNRNKSGTSEFTAIAESRSSMTALPRERLVRTLAPTVFCPSTNVEQCLQALTVAGEKR